MTDPLRFRFPLVAGLLVLLTTLHLLGCRTGGPARDDTLRFTGKTVACADFQVFVADTSGTFVLALVPKNYPAARDTYDLDLKPEEEIQARIYRLGTPHTIQALFCNDIETDLKIVDSMAVSGGSFHARKYSKEPGPAFTTYLLDLDIRNLRYRDAAGREHTLERVKLDSLAAGWEPG